MESPLIICNGKVEITAIDHSKKNIKCNVHLYFSPVAKCYTPAIKQYVSNLSIVAATHLQHEGFIPYCSKVNEWTIDSVGVYKEHDFQK